jgi:hypothetical protein
MAQEKEKTKTGQQIRLMDTIRINGKPTPGIARVEPIAQSIDWIDVRAFAGDSEATKFGGNKLKEFSVKFLFDYDQMLAWMKDFHGLLEQPAPGTKDVPNAAKPVDVVHNYFSLAKLRLAVTVELTGPYYDAREEAGMWVVLWKAKEYREPKQPLAAKLVQPIIGPEGQPRAETAIERQTRVTEEDTVARVRAYQDANAGIPKS